jgi:hypothetical protein
MNANKPQALRAPRAGAFFYGCNRPRVAPFPAERPSPCPGRHDGRASAWPMVGAAVLAWVAFNFALVHIALG